MAVRGTSVSKIFDDIKKKNPGMSDSAAMQKAIEESSRKVLQSRKPKRKKLGPLEKLMMGVKKELKSKYHSPAGRKFLGR